MGVRLLLGLLAAMVLGVARLQGQDSSDSSDTSTSTDASNSDAPSEAAAVSDVSPDAVSVTDVSDVGLTAESVNNIAPDLGPVTDPTLAFAAQQALDAITNPWGGRPQPIDVPMFLAYRSSYS